MLKHDLLVVGKMWCNNIVVFWMDASISSEILYSPFFFYNFIQYIKVTKLVSTFYNNLKTIWIDLESLRVQVELHIKSINNVI